MIFLLAGFFGLAAGGLLSLSAALIAAALEKRRPSGQLPLRSLTILIPAHNEEAVISATITSIRDALKSAGMSGMITVAADNCSDRTAAIAAESGASVKEVQCASKWKTILALLPNVKSDWVALVDAGAIWPEKLLQELRKYFGDTAFSCVAPAYLPASASQLERLLWKIEARWKKWENHAGGPISLHGATIFYRTEDLRLALQLLEKKKQPQWLNDDIATPLALRMAVPSARIHYAAPPACPPISDAGLSENTAQVLRRIRMLRGNRQWLIGLWPQSLLLCPAAGFLAVRRLLRVFWAYWALFFLLGLCVIALGPKIISFLLALTLALAAALGLWLAGKRGIVDAAAVSLFAPILAWWPDDARWS